jgi:hypothetical protein
MLTGWMRLGGESVPSYLKLAAQVLKNRCLGLDYKVSPRPRLVAMVLAAVTALVAFVNACGEAPSSFAARVSVYFWR